MKFTHVLCVLFLVPMLVSSKISSIDFPAKLKKCYEKYCNTQPSGITGEMLYTYCMNIFAWENCGKFQKYVPEKSAEDYIRRISTESSEARSKRSLSSLPFHSPRTRMEYRQMTDDQRHTFHECLNRLKYTPAERNPNIARYEALVEVHNWENAGEAHFGPHFLSWHRIYLFLLENALREVHPDCSDVSLPYWDSTLEFYAEEHTKGSARSSVIFSEDFAGSPERVVSGPFRNWGLIRNVAREGTFGRDKIDLILSRNRTEDITTWGGDHADYNIEIYHNSLHRFVGGYLMSLTNAPKDPIFFMLHTFIDYIWELFRKNLEQKGEDPSRYPDNSRLRRNDNITAFPGWKNEDGFSNIWSEKVIYLPSFNCENCNADGFSWHIGEWQRWMECKDIGDSGRQCVALPVASNESPARKRRKRSVKSSTKVKQCDGITCPFDDTSIQNTFDINGKVNADAWVYLPVEIVNERPAGLKFGSFNRYSDQKCNISMDTFDPNNDHDLASKLKTGEAQCSKLCRISNSGSTKISVRADGINYCGNSIEYAIIDGRLPIMSQNAFVPIKDPMNAKSKVCLMANDECGRMCLPTCLVKGSSPLRYKPCTGCIKVDKSFPKMYGRTVANVIKRLWKFEEESPDYTYACKKKDAVFLRFLCDSSSTLPWKRLQN